jgi:hypothetical protein
MKPKKIIICKNHSSDVIQTYLFSIGYSWKKNEEYDFAKDYKSNIRFFGDVVIILLDDELQRP